MAQEQMTLRGTLQGHGGWVTQIATNPQYPDTILSASRGKLLLFTITSCHILQYISPLSSSMNTINYTIKEVLSLGDLSFLPIQR